MKLKGVEVGALVRKRLRSKDRGRLFLELLTRDASSLSPEYFGFFEPVKTPFDASNLSAVLAQWGRRFLWRRARPRLSGQVVHGPENAHDVVYLSLTTSAFDESTVSTFLAGLQRVFGVELAYIHGRVAADISDREEYFRHMMPFSQGLTTHDLREGIPGFPWMLFFGPAYVGLLGRDRLLTVPAARVEAVGDGIAIRLTNSVSDCANSRSEYQMAGIRAKAFLETNVFRSPGRNSEIPKFVFDQT